MSLVTPHVIQALQPRSGALRPGRTLPPTDTTDTQA